jgi:hypothetical protein
MGKGGSNIKPLTGSPAIGAIAAGRGVLTYDLNGATRSSHDDAGAVHH